MEISTFQPFNLMLKSSIIYSLSTTTTEAIHNSFPQYPNLKSFNKKPTICPSVPADGIIRPVIGPIEGRRGPVTKDALSR